MVSLSNRMCNMNSSILRKTEGRRRRLLPLAKAGDAKAQFELGCALDFERPNAESRRFGSTIRLPSKDMRRLRIFLVSRTVTAGPSKLTPRRP